MLGVALLLFTVGKASAVPPPAAAGQEPVERPARKAAAPELTPEEMEQRAFDYYYGTARRPQNRTKAIEWLERAAAAGRPISQVAMARMYWDGAEVPKDEARAIELFTAAANQGVPSAQGFLGWAYAQGAGVPVDLAQGTRWMEAAASQGDPYALRSLANYYAYRAVPKDPQRGKRLALRAAELNDNDARVFAYTLLTRGPTEVRDPQLGLYFLNRGVEANHGRCTYRLALEYLFGLNVPHDPAHAAQLMERAMRLQRNEATLWLSQFYLKGIGVTRDAERSAQLLEEGLKVSSLQEKNSVAWDLSVSPRDELRDGAMALRILEPALAASEDKPPGIVDTLAAAYAETGHFDRAVKTQQDAIDRQRAAHPDSDVSELEKHLALYKRHEPYREVP